MYFVRFCVGIGCGPPPHLNGASAILSDGVMAISCNSSGETWFLTCRDGSWVGKVGACAPAVAESRAHEKWNVFKNREQFPYGNMPFTQESMKSV